MKRIILNLREIKTAENRLNKLENFRDASKLMSD